VTDTTSPIEGLEEVVERFDHVSIAVRDIDSVSPLISLLGAEYLDSGLGPGENFRWIQYSLPGWGRLELIAAVESDPANFITRFIDERGEGLHHLTFKVTDIIEATERAVALGFLVTRFDDTLENWKEAFIHPRSAHGVLIQLAEFPDKDD